MDEVGIDISKQTSNTFLDLKDIEMDYVIRICGNFNVCPIFIGRQKYFKKPLQDTYSFKGTGTEKIELLREIRDEIGDWIQDFHYYINGKSNILTFSDCCELLGSEEDDICCDPMEANFDCCSFDPSDSTLNKDPP